MARQTPFPGIIVESIRVKAGGGGRTLSFEEGLPENVTKERIQSLVDKVPLFGDSHVESKLVYNFRVAAYSSTTAKAKTKAFVRMANPFSPGVVRATSITENEENAFGGRSDYSVTVEVTK